MKKLLVLLLTLCLVFGMAACGSASPSDALKADMENAKSNPEEIMGDIGEDGFGEKATQALVDKVLEFEYDLGEEVINGETATVETTITTYPFGDIFKTVITNYITAAFQSETVTTDDQMLELMDKLLIEELEKAEKTYTKTVTITLEQEDGAWVVQEDDEMANALTGGMLDFANNMNQ